MMAATAIPTMNSLESRQVQIEHVHLHDAMSRFSLEVASPSAVNLHRLLRTRNQLLFNN